MRWNYSTILTWLRLSAVLRLSVKSGPLVSLKTRNEWLTRLLATEQLIMAMFKPLFADDSDNRCRLFRTA
jgi:hypothetical protein